MQYMPIKYINIEPWTKIKLELVASKHPLIVHRRELNPEKNDMLM